MRVFTQKHTAIYIFIGFTKRKCGAGRVFLIFAIIEKLAFAPVRSIARSHDTAPDLEGVWSTEKKMKIKDDNDIFTFSFIFL